MGRSYSLTNENQKLKLDTEYKQQGIPILKPAMKARHKAYKLLQKKILLGIFLIQMGSGPYTVLNAEQKAEQLKIFRHKIKPGVEFRFTSDREEHFSMLESDLERGLMRLYTVYNREALQINPQFWLIGQPRALENILASHKKLNQHQIQSILAQRVYRDNKDIFVLYLDGIDRDEVLRLVFQEYSRRLMESRAHNFANTRIGWFHTGMPTYMAWYILGDIRKVNIMQTHAALIRYYCPDFDPQKAIELSRLERNSSWQFAVKSDPRLVFAQSVLSYMYLSSKVKPQAGLLLLENLHQPRDFPQEFERVSGLHLHEFETSMQKNLYPEIKRWRKRLKVEPDLKAPRIRLQTIQDKISRNYTTFK